MYAVASAVGLVLTLLQIVVGVLAAVLVARRVGPPARTPAVLGCLALPVAALVGVGYSWLLPVLVDRGLPIGLISVPGQLLQTVLAVAGLALLVQALLLAGRKPSGQYGSYAGTGEPQPPIGGIPGYPRDPAPGAGGPGRPPSR